MDDMGIHITDEVIELDGEHPIVGKRLKQATVEPVLQSNEQATLCRVQIGICVKLVSVCQIVNEEGETVCLGQHRPSHSFRIGYQGNRPNAIDLHPQDLTGTGNPEHQPQPPRTPQPGGQRHRHRRTYRKKLVSFEPGNQKLIQFRPGTGLDLRQASFELGPWIASTSTRRKPLAVARHLPTEKIEGRRRCIGNLTLAMVQKNLGDVIEHRSTR
ncbi:MAG: hypothetical protein FIA97_05240 [Methylococcaceae bacterium]|nr:hypothetical protein [Methylococcaceae bacterium]